MGNDFCSIKPSCCQAKLQSKYELRVEDVVPTHRSPTHKVSMKLSHSQNMLFEAKTSSTSEGVWRHPQDFPIVNEERLMRLEEAVHFSKLCELKVQQSATLDKNTAFRINAQGYENSKRDKKDGVTYFGCKRRLSTQNPGEALNDIVIPNQDPHYDELHRGRHFQIAYDVDLDAYFIKDLGVGFGTFIKVEFELTLKDNYLIQMGDSFLIANFMSTDFTRLRLKLFGGVCSGEVFFFSSTEAARCPIRIGRLADCEVRVEDSLLSKRQATISYSAKKGWLLQDGDPLQGKSSTNGTW
mmetsp:Transcript_1878/g.4046  ORF Transcript_1878/g.4046 Transcript_1878/m.4046 type:complete len:297 (-) Transcript_1878:2849-3739(-)